MNKVQALMEQIDKLREANAAYAVEIARLTVEVHFLRQRIPMVVEENGSSRNDDEVLTFPDHAHPVKDSDTYFVIKKKGT